MNGFRGVGVAGAVVAAWPLAAAGDVINFDDLSPFTVVTNQYGSAVFSTVPGEDCLVDPFTNGGNSAPNIMCTGANGVVDCIKPVFVDFPSAVNGLTFLAVEPNEFGVVATISIFQNGVHTDDVDLIGLSQNPGEFANGNKIVDLSSYGHITRIEINGPGGQGNLDSAYGGNGIGWDDFSYSVVPGPGAGSLLVVGGVVAVWRRRR